MTQTALLIETTVAVLGGPIAGVVIAQRRARDVTRGRQEKQRKRWGTLAMTVGAALGFTALCLAANALGGRGLAAPTAAPHVTLGAAFLAACAVGVACGRSFDDPLDGVGWSLAIAACASFGVFVLGPSIAGAPPLVVKAALTLSPVSATASAANIDIFRSEPFYQLSPLAHTHLVYPAWTTATLLYLVIALVSLAGSLRTPEMQGLSAPTQGLC